MCAQARDGVLQKKVLQLYCNTSSILFASIANNPGFDNVNVGAVGFSYPVMNTLMTLLIV